MMAYEPLILVTPIGMYLATRSFAVHDIASHASLLVVTLPGIFVGFLFALVIKFRKSPFDLSMSHHAHQELVRGITTEFSARTLAMIEVAHWYETVFLLGWVYLFFASRPALGVIVALLAFVMVILVDNIFARLKWPVALRSSWAVAVVLGFGNILVLSVIKG
jgi:NADH:ubiquinone oxidoreductase subunit H